MTFIFLDAPFLDVMDPDIRRENFYHIGGKITKLYVISVSGYP